MKTVTYQNRPPLDLSASPPIIDGPTRTALEQIQRRVLWLAPAPIVSTMVRSDLIPCSLWRYSAAKKTSAKAVAASFQVGSLAIEGCILAKGMRSFFATRSASSERDDGGSALPAAPRHRDSRYFAIASCSQMGTELCPSG